MMLTSTVNLLKTLSLSAGIYADVLQTDATWTLCGLLRMLVESGANDKSGKDTVFSSAVGCLKKCRCVLAECSLRLSGGHSHRQVSQEQHRSWCTLGFIRSIALKPQICGTLSTSAWISLLIQIVEGHQSFNAITLQRQVGHVNLQTNPTLQDREGVCPLVNFSKQN